jgi:DNA repair protein RecO (recombination protein O)
MLHQTEGIVLRSVKFRESSIVTTIYTAAFGIQSYLVNGVYSAKKGRSDGARFQPGALLDLVVYHNAQKRLQRIREAAWSVVYSSLLSDVVKNCAALYITELLHKSIRQPEPNAELYAFLRDNLLSLDESGAAVTANIPLYVTIHLPRFLGFGISGSTASEERWLDLQEGSYVDKVPPHPHFISGEQAQLTARLLAARNPRELEGLVISKALKRELYNRYQEYYLLHVPEFGRVKSLEVLNAIF